MNSLALHLPAAPVGGGDGPPPRGLVRVARATSLAWVLTPERFEPGRRYPVVTVLHGAGRQDELLARAYRDEPARRGVLIAVVRSHDYTWDLIAGGDGHDLEFLAWLLAWLDVRYPTDATRRALVGYSDGASYALALALSNPRLFAAAIGWAAGFLAIDTANLTPGDPKPRVLLEHGTHDQVFPFERVALPLRDLLVRLGYDVTFRVDEGGIHWPSAGFQAAALDWFLGAP